MASIVRKGAKLSKGWKPRGPMASGSGGHSVSVPRGSSKGNTASASSKPKPKGGGGAMSGFGSSAISNPKGVGGAMSGFVSRASAHVGVLRASGALDRLLQRRPATLSESLLKEFGPRADAGGFVRFESADGATRGLALVDRTTDPPIRLLYGIADIDEAYLRYGTVRYRPHVLFPLSCVLCNASCVLY